MHHDARDADPGVSSTQKNKGAERTSRHLVCIESLKMCKALKKMKAGYGGEKSMLESLECRGRPIGRMRDG